MRLNGLVLYFVFYLIGLYGPHALNASVAYLFYIISVFGVAISCMTKTPLTVKIEDFSFFAGVALAGVMLTYFTEDTGNHEFYHAVYVLAFVALCAILGTRADNRAQALAEKSEVVQQ
ncbi:MAG: hypothetical protein HYT37_02625 [Candidatus Sungbacteria bacterium]|nr:hypothetical protein [Candidatus Sungbacteria bacterium]